MTDNVLDIPVKKIDGSDTTLADYRGKVIMVVNVASKCGLTVQYEGLEKLYEESGTKVLSSPAFRPTISRARNRAVIKRFWSSAR